jgi:hypothetical protein
MGKMAKKDGKIRFVEVVLNPQVTIEAAGVKILHNLKIERASKVTNITL